MCIEERYDNYNYSSLPFSLHISNITHRDFSADLLQWQYVNHDPKTEYPRFVCKGSYIQIDGWGF